MKYWQTPQFKAQQELWHQKLKSSGFEDQEEEIGGQWQLKQRASNVYRQADLVVRSAKERYYELLGQALQERRGRHPFMMGIMRMHHRGMTNIEICRKLTTVDMPVNKHTVGKVIAHMAKLWKLHI